MVYHYTKKNKLESVLRNGLMINQRPVYTSDFFVDNLLTAYGMAPIFCFTNKNNKAYNLDGDSVLLGFDEKKFTIGADIGTLVDFGAYLEDSGFWFKGDEFQDFYNENGELSYELLTDNSSFIKEAVKKTGTLVILENIPPNMIHVFP